MAQMYFVSKYLALVGWLVGWLAAGNLNSWLQLHCLKLESHQCKAVTVQNKCRHVVISCISPTIYDS